MSKFKVPKIWDLKHEIKLHIKIIQLSLTKDPQNLKRKSPMKNAQIEEKNKNKKGTWKLATKILARDKWKRKSCGKVTMKERDFQWQEFVELMRRK